MFASSEGIFFIFPGLRTIFILFCTILVLFARPHCLLLPFLSDGHLKYPQLSELFGEFNEQQLEGHKEGTQIYNFNFLRIIYTALF